jgi:hypothetical protein
MTTRKDITGIWAGQTVAILGAGPDMTEELALTAKGFKTIACNRAIKFAPWCDMFIALDPHHPFWEEADKLGFKGIRILGVERDDYDALYLGMMYETVQIDPSHTIQIRNNALAAIRIAEMVGAKKIILLGFDPDRYEEVHKSTGFYGLKQGLEQIIAELGGKGIEMERIDSKEQKPGTKPLRRSEIVDKPVDVKTFPQPKPIKK